MYCSYFFLIFLIVWMCSFIYLVFKPQSIPLVWISSVFDWLSFLFSKFQFDFLVFYLFVEFMFYILYWLSYFGWMVTCVVFEFIREFVHFFFYYFWTFLKPVFGIPLSLDFTLFSLKFVTIMEFLEESQSLDFFPCFLYFCIGTWHVQN